MDANGDINGYVDGDDGDVDGNDGDVDGENGDEHSDEPDDNAGNMKKDDGVYCPNEAQTSTPIWTTMY